MKNLKTYLILILIFISSYIPAQSLGDFRSKQDGNWNNPNSWEYFNGISWVDASTINPPAGIYPGITGIITNNVTIVGGNEITLNISPIENINSVTIGDLDRTTFKDILFISINATIKTSSFTIANDGQVTWNNVGLTLNADASISVESNDAGYGLDIQTPCSASKAIYLGSIKYAICNQNSNSADYSFSDLNNLGGNLSINPTSNSPICVNQQLNLIANPGGNLPDNYSWSVISTPAGSSYSFNSTLETPNTTLTNLGTYIFRLIVTKSVTVPNSKPNKPPKVITISATKDITVNVNTTPNTPTGNNNQGFCKSTSPTLANLVVTGTNILWYTSISSTTPLPITTPLTTNTFYASQSIGTCESNRFAVNVTINSCKVITNRRITYRVKKQ